MEDETKDLFTEIERFKSFMDGIVTRSTDLYRSVLLDEEASKQLLIRIGEIPNIQGPSNEHKTDT